MRGQIELPAFAIAVLLLTFTLVLGITAANTAFSNAERSALERQTAVSVSDQLVGEASPVTARENVLNASAIDELESVLEGDEIVVPDSAAIEVRLGDEVIAERGSISPASASTIERLVLVEDRSVETVEPMVTDAHAMTIPRRSYNTTVTIADEPTGSVHTVRANDEVLLANDDGLTGTFSLATSPQETTRIQFEMIGYLDAGDVTLQYEAPATRKATLTVIVDD